MKSLILYIELKNNDKENICMIFYVSGNTTRYPMRRTGIIESSIKLAVIDMSRIFKYLRHLLFRGKWGIIRVALKLGFSHLILNETEDYNYKVKSYNP